MTNLSEGMVRVLWKFMRWVEKVRDISIVRTLTLMTTYGH